MKPMLHYQLIDKLGEGGMGEVWRARDTTLDREVAIKMLPEAFSGDPERLARFEREAKLLASLNHPNIAAIYGLHEAEGQRFLAMELVPGVDLAERIEQLETRPDIDLDGTVFAFDADPDVLREKVEGFIKTIDAYLARENQ